MGHIIGPFAGDMLSQYKSIGSTRFFQYDDGNENGQDAGHCDADSPGHTQFDPSKVCPHPQKDNGQDPDRAESRDDKNLQEQKYHAQKHENGDKNRPIHETYFSPLIFWTKIFEPSTRMIRMGSP